MSFARGTTPTITMQFSATKYPDLDLTATSDVVVTFRSGMRIINKEDNYLDVDEKSIGIYLTQRDTLGFGKIAKIQANWLTPEGKRGSSKVYEIPVDEQLLEKVMTND